MRAFQIELLAAFVGFFTPDVVFASARLHHADRRHQHIHRHAQRGILSGSNSASSSTSGDHECRPATAEQQRGPCPGLNALANCGYIPRSGVVSFLEVMEAMTEVVGLSPELALILAVLGVVWTGNPISLNPSFSIGGTDPNVQNLLGNALGLLGEPRGIDHSHNMIESDSSPTRDDLYKTGNPVTMNLTTFEILYDMIPESSDQTYTLDTLADFAMKRFNDSVNNNSRFYYGPFTGMIARNTGFCFITNLFSSYPSGDSNKPVLTHEALKCWYGVTGERGNFVYNVGHEAIPDNWHSRPGLGYGLVNLNLDIVYMITKYPIFASIGGNAGTVNSFTGLNLADPVDGLANVPKLLESNNLICFALEIVNMAAPNYLNSLVATLVDPAKLLLDKISAPLLNLECPQLGEITQGGAPFLEYLNSKYPGASTSGGGLGI